MLALNASGARVSLNSTMAGRGVGGAARGVRYRSASGSTVERDAARMARVQKLRELLSGAPARLHPRPARALDRPRELTLSLRRALIRQRQDLLPQRLEGAKLQ